MPRLRASSSAAYRQRWRRKPRAASPSCGRRAPTSDTANIARRSRWRGPRRSLLSSGCHPPDRPISSMTAYFVTSTGTDIGKTFVTAGLIRHLRGEGRAAAALKPLVSGYDSSVVETSDPAVLLRAMGRPVSADEIAAIAPFRFRAPLSPDLAAAREGRNVDFAALLRFSRDAVAAHEGTLFIEGVGGIMVPVDADRTV